MKTTNLEDLQILPNKEILLPVKEVKKSVQVLTARNGELTVKCSNILLHSLYNPVKEAVRFIESANIERGNLVLLYGLGLGYHVEQLIQKIGPKGHVVIVELNRNILSAALYFRDLDSINKYNNVTIISGYSENEAAVYISNILNKYFPDYEELERRVIIHPASYKCIPRGFEKVKTSLELLLMEEDGNTVFGKLEAKNIKANLDIILRSQGVKSIYGKYNNQSVILVSAGPSLDRVLPYLKYISRYYFIICVDTVLSLLLNEGIDPDMIISIDPQESSINCFMNHLDEKIPLIFIPTANPKIVNNYSGKKYVIIKDLGKKFSKITKLLKFKGVTNAGGSVSCILLDILVKLGFSSIIFTGQDCGFPNMRVYANNTYTVNSWAESLNKYRTVDTFHKRWIARDRVIDVKDIFSKNIQTHRNLYSYLKNIEEYTKLHDKIKFINYTASGVMISNTETVPFPPILKGKKKPPQADEFEDNINTALKDEIVSLII